MNAKGAAQVHWEYTKDTPKTFYTIEFSSKENSKNLHPRYKSTRCFLIYKALAYRILKALSYYGTFYIYFYAALFSVPCSFNEWLTVITKEKITYYKTELNKKFNFLVGLSFYL